MSHFNCPLQFAPSPLPFHLLNKKPTSQIMASIVCMSHAVGFINTTKTSSCSSFVYNKQRRLVVVRAESINPDIRKTEDKVVDAVVVTELSKPLTAYCRCWRSGTFPLCDGAHVKHNKATGDNVGPLLLKKQ